MDFVILRLGTTYAYKQKCPERMNYSLRGIGVGTLRLKILISTPQFLLFSKKIR